MEIIIGYFMIGFFVLFFGSIAVFMGYLEADEMYQKRLKDLVAREDAITEKLPTFAQVKNEQEIAREGFRRAAEYLKAKNGKHFTYENAEDLMEDLLRVRKAYDF